jgi:hypothetical protein
MFYKEGLQPMRIFIVLILVFMTLTAGANADNLLVSNILDIADGYHGYGNTSYHSPVQHEIRTTNAPYTVRYLGCYDENQDGLAIPHEIYIWEFSEHNASLLASAIVPAGTNAPLYAGCRWAKLPEPAVLPANTNFVLSSLGLTSDPQMNTLDGRYVVQIAYVQGNDVLLYGDWVWAYGVDWGKSLDGPGMAVTTYTNIALGANVASEIDIFNPENSLLVITNTSQNCYDVELKNPSPFYNYHLEYSTELTSNTWNEVLEANILLAPESNGLWKVSNACQRCYFKAVTNTP